MEGKKKKQGTKKEMGQVGKEAEKEKEDEVMQDAPITPPGQTKSKDEGRTKPQ